MTATILPFQRKRQPGKGGPRYNSPVRIQARVRCEQARNLYAQGWTYAQIAQQLGYASKSAAYRAIQRPIGPDGRGNGGSGGVVA